MPSDLRKRSFMPERFSYLTVDALACYRLTRLVTEDHLPFGPVRDHLAERQPDSLITEWMHCPWCAGAWVAVGVVGARALLPRAWPAAAAVLALSAVAGLLSTWEQN